MIYLIVLPAFVILKNEVVPSGAQLPGFDTGQFGSFALLLFHLLLPVHHRLNGCLCFLILGGEFHPFCRIAIHLILHLFQRFSPLIQALVPLEFAHLYLITPRFHLLAEVTTAIGDLLDATLQPGHRVIGDVQTGNQ